MVIEPLPVNILIVPVNKLIVPVNILIVPVNKLIIPVKILIVAVKYIGCICEISVNSVKTQPTAGVQLNLCLCTEVQ